MATPPTALHQLQTLLTTSPNPHTALQSLRDTNDPNFLFLRSFFDLHRTSSSPQQEELLYHCIAGCRHTLLQQFASLPVEFTSRVRDYFFSVGLELGGDARRRAVTLACLNLSASFWKRMWIEDVAASSGSIPQEIWSGMEHCTDTFQNSKELFQFVNEGIVSSSSEVHICCSFLTTFMNEFSNVKGYNLPMEFHKSAHAKFESDEPGLTSIYRMVCQALLTTPKDEVTLLSLISVLDHVLGWDFGMLSSSSTDDSKQELIRIPFSSWRECFLQPEFIGSIFRYLHRSNPKDERYHTLRQVILSLASISSNKSKIFENEQEKIAYVNYFSHQMLSYTQTLSQYNTEEGMEGVWLDIASIFTRLISNFQFSIISQISNFHEVLHVLQSIGTTVLTQSLAQCELLQGNVEEVDGEEGRRECLAIVLEGCVLLIDQAAGTDISLLSPLAPLYTTYLTHRIRMCALEEYHIASAQTDLDEIREEISSLTLEEEMICASSLGRLFLESSIDGIMTLLTKNLEQLRGYMDGDGSGTDIPPAYAASLEECRLLILSLGYLFTDENEGEEAEIPEPLMAHMASPSLKISESIRTLVNFTEYQAYKLSQNALDVRLSPLVCTSLLWFWNRWSKVYLSNSNELESMIAFGMNIILCFVCHWPQEHGVLDTSCQFFHTLSKKFGKSLIQLPSFSELLNVFCSTVTSTHVGKEEGTLQECGFQRISYKHRGRILSGILMACSDAEEERCRNMFHGVLETVRGGFESWIVALSNNQISSQDVANKETASLCIELFCGIASTSEIQNPERIPVFVTPTLPLLSRLMTFYAKDLSICESLLTFFRDYAEQFITILNRDQCLTLFHACAELLQNYSSNHCHARVIHLPASLAELEEEQSYNDVLCAIQLLIHLGTKDFIDACSTNHSTDSTHVTDVIFFGLQQILPLMTQGLLQYPKLATQYFNLVGFMMDTYPDKACALPYDLFMSLLESLLFGMGHDTDAYIAKSSLCGIGEVAREHWKTGAMSMHLARNPDIWKICTMRLFEQVIFQRKRIWDRMESTSMVLLPLVAVDIQRFSGEVMKEISVKVCMGDELKRARLENAFQRLFHEEVVYKVMNNTTGYEGRTNRIRFKQDFEVFVKDVHSFLVIE